jgi:hypothetical protein
VDLDTFKPAFLIEIEGQSLSKGGSATGDVTQEIESFSFTDNEEEMDELELKVSNRNLQFVDDPLFQEGNEIVARFGYLSACGHALAGVGNLSPRKKAVIKEIDYGRTRRSPKAFAANARLPREGCAHHPHQGLRQGLLDCGFRIGDCGIQTE